MHRCLYTCARLMVSLVLAGGTALFAECVNPLQAQPSREQPVEVVTPTAIPAGLEEAMSPPTSEVFTSAPEEGVESVEPTPTPTFPGESPTQTPNEAPPHPSLPLETPFAQETREVTEIETPTQPDESPFPTIEIVLTDVLPLPAISETPPAQETSTAEMIDSAPPAEGALPLPSDVPPVQETSDISTTVEAPAIPQNDPLSSPSSTPTLASTAILPSDLPFIAQNMPGVVVVNEIGWAGTSADVTAQWIELYNTTAEPIWLNDWRLTTADGRLVIELAGVIAAQGYFLLECNNDLTIRDIPADNIYAGTLSPDGETLYLVDASGALIDTANGDGGPWPAG
ncbi:MAG: hypothetical protein DDG58_04715, partial [Ardenticatenia bacterium]